MKTLKDYMETAVSWALKIIIAIGVYGFFEGLPIDIYGLLMELFK